MATIKQLRDERNMSQETLAYLAGVSFATINRVEQGKPCFRSTLALIAGVLNVDTKDIAGVNVAQRRTR